MDYSLNENNMNQIGQAPEELVKTIRRLAERGVLAVPGGGCASFKQVIKNLVGEDEEIIWVDNGWIDPIGSQSGRLTPLRLKPLAGLVRLESLMNTQLLNEIACSRTQAESPAPPIDALLHAVLPFPVILFTHPDEVLAIACAVDGSDRLVKLYGETVLSLPYAPSGLPLARACHEALKSRPLSQVMGIFIQHQGLVTFGETAQTAYDNLVLLTAHAEQYLKDHQAHHLPVAGSAGPEAPIRNDLAALRKTVSDITGFPLILAVNPHPAMMTLARREDLENLAGQGLVLASDAPILKYRPMTGRDAAGYRAAYEQVVKECFAEDQRPGVDVAPRVILDPEYGMCSLGRSAAEAGYAGQRYLHTIDIILHAMLLGGFQPLPACDAFAVEAQANQGICKNPGQGRLFAGEVALVTGGASGIGKACVESLLERGAAVVSLDINPKVKTLFDRPDYLGLECDLTDEAAILKAFEAAVRAFGGLDMLVLNAGIFPAGCRIEALTLAEWQKVMRINLDSNVLILREAYPLLKQSPRSGRVLVNASKNVLAPGAGAAAYSASKAAVTQIARVAALEWGKDRIRVNMIHPDAIFDTGIWTEDVLKARAAHYGMTVQQYKTRNVLGVELNSHYVGELVAEMLGPRFEKITGAQIPVDGGSDRVI